MWWCCGRRSKEDPGCKYSKHQITEQEEHGILGSGLNDGAEYDEDVNFKAKVVKQRSDNIRCYVSDDRGIDIYIIVLQTLGSLR